MTAKKCTKKRDARAKIVVLLTKPIVFLNFSLPSPSSDLKVPNNLYLRVYVFSLKRLIGDTHTKKE